MKTPLLLTSGFWMWESGQIKMVSISWELFPVAQFYLLNEALAGGWWGWERRKWGWGLEDWLLSLFGCFSQVDSSRFLVFLSLDIRSPVWNQGKFSNKKCVQIFLKMLIWDVIPVCSRSETEATTDFRLNILFRLSSFSSEVGKKTSCHFSMSFCKDLLWRQVENAGSKKGGIGRNWHRSSKTLQKSCLKDHVFGNHINFYILLCSLEGP